MAWVEFHANQIVRLKKFHDLRKAVSWSQLEGLGFLGRFWCLVIEVRENGDVSDWDADYLSEVMGFTNQVGSRAWEALVKFNWLEKTADGKIIVHDWVNFAGTYLRNKYAKDHKGKLVEIWRLYGKEYGANAKPIGNQLETNRTLPNLTLPNQEEKYLCGEPTKTVVSPAGVSPPDEVFLDFPVCKGDKSWSLGKSKIAEWKVSFPGVNVESECRKAWQWVNDNPLKKKTSTGMLKFLNGWLSRAQNTQSSYGSHKTGGRTDGFTVER